MYVSSFLVFETCMQPVCLVLSCLTPDFCLALDFVYLYKRGLLYAQTVLTQILSLVILPLTRPQAAPNVTVYFVCCCPSKYSNNLLIFVFVVKVHVV